MHQNSAKFHNSAVFQLTKLFGVLVVKYEVMDLQKWDKFKRGYFWHTKFGMWDRPDVGTRVETSKWFHFVACNV